MTTIRLASLTLAASATLATLTGLAAPALAQSGAPPATPALKPAVVTAILDKSGGNIGTATLTGGPNATILRIAVRAGGCRPAGTARISTRSGIAPTRPSSRTRRRTSIITARSTVSSTPKGRTRATCRTST